MRLLLFINDPGKTVGKDRTSSFCPNRLQGTTR
uniref:Uncharacterized protein n=1 Tax=Anguilla anguilla TaxID=7936 RepID=A0A0E9TTI0_ANGAN